MATTTTCYQLVSENFNDNGRNIRVMTVTVTRKTTPALERLLLFLCDSARELLDISGYDYLDSFYCHSAIKLKLKLS